ncbi:MAG: transporter substrate-binding domain-containing protein [Ilumatobacteraceae bacterium]
MPGATRPPRRTRRRTPRPTARPRTPAADDAIGDAQLPDHDSLSFGALWETPPIIGVDTEDTTVPVGAAPDLAAALAPILGVEVEWQNMQWPAQLPGVQSGVVDALFGQVSVTEERELSIVDLIPFTKTTFSLLLPEGTGRGHPARWRVRFDHRGPGRVGADRVGRADQRGVV